MSADPVADVDVGSRSLRLNGLAASLASFVLHALVIAALILMAQKMGRGGHRAPARRSTIALSFADSATRTPDKSPALEKPKDPVPTPSLDRTSTPKARPHPSTARPAKPSSAAPVQKEDDLKPKDDSDADIAGRIHDNWPEPPGLNRDVHCKVTIAYAVGGSIHAVSFVPRCGNAALEDSIRRAVWKTRPLPLKAAQQAAGSIEVDFTP